MRLVMTLLVRNEQDILRENLEFHFGRGVDFVIATDNLSCDATPDILREYERDGRLRLIREEQDDYSQDLWVTRMARMAAADFAADWVINSDADEFWWPLATDLKAVLARQDPAVAACRCPRLQFVTVPETAGTRFWQGMVYRQAVATNEFGKPLPPKVLHRASPDVVVHQGNHRVDGLAGACVACEAVEILHFPIRSYGQFRAKVEHGGAACARNTRLPNGVVPRWREQYELLRKGVLKKYFDDLVYAPDEVEAGLGDGSLLHDDRLAGHFAGIAARRAPGGH